MNTPTLPVLTGTAVTLRPHHRRDTDLIVKWRNTQSVVQNFIFRQTFTPEMHRSWLATKVATGQVVQYIILDNADGKPVGSVYYRDIDNHNRSAEYGIFIGEESARGKGLAPKRPACSPILALRGCTCTASACACWPKMPPPAAAMKRPALCRRVFSAIWSCWTEPTATSSLWPSWRRTDVKKPMQKIRTCLQKTPNALLCALGAVVFLAGFYFLCYRTPLNEVWLPTTMNNDEALYNRQVVSVLTHGGPQGYFGYQESTADIGRYGTWGPLLIWAYALPGLLFGASVNVVLWCNLLLIAVASRCLPAARG